MNIIIFVYLFRKGRAKILEQKFWIKILDKHAIYLLCTFYPLLKKVEQNPKKGCNEVRAKS